MTVAYVCRYFILIKPASVYGGVLADKDLHEDSKIFNTIQIMCDQLWKCDKERIYPAGASMHQYANIPTRSVDALNRFTVPMLVLYGVIFIITTGNLLTYFKYW